MQHSITKDEIRSYLEKQIERADSNLSAAQALCDAYVAQKANDAKTIAKNEFQDGVFAKLKRLFPQVTDKAAIAAKAQELLQECNEEEYEIDKYAKTLERENDPIYLEFLKNIETYYKELERLKKQYQENHENKVEKTKGPFSKLWSYLEGYGLAVFKSTQEAYDDTVSKGINTLKDQEDFYPNFRQALIGAQDILKVGGKLVVSCFKNMTDGFDLFYRALKADRESWKNRTRDMAVGFSRMILGAVCIAFFVASLVTTIAIAPLVIAGGACAAAGVACYRQLDIYNNAKKAEYSSKLELMQALGIKGKWPTEITFVDFQRQRKIADIQDKIRENKKLSADELTILNCYEKYADARKKRIEMRDKLPFKMLGFGMAAVGVVATVLALPVIFAIAGAVAIVVTAVVTIEQQVRQYKETKEIALHAKKELIDQLQVHEPELDRNLSYSKIEEKMNGLEESKRSKLLPFYQKYIETRESRQDAKWKAPHTTLKILSKAAIVTAVLLGALAVFGVSVASFGLAPLILVAVGTVVHLGASIVENVKETRQKKKEAAAKKETGVELQKNKTPKFDDLQRKVIKEELRLTRHAPTPAIVPAQSRLHLVRECNEQQRQLALQERRQQLVTRGDTRRLVR